MKRIAAITMVRNDDFFLSKWVGYYGRQLGKENLHVIFDGLDQKVPEFCDRVNVERVEHVKGNVHEADRGRIDLVSQRAAMLFDRYDMVIGTDVDEFLVVDPLLGQTLAQFLSGVTTGLPSISGLGVDVGQKIGEEADIDASRPFLSQRSYAKLSTRYSKASVLLRWPGARASTGRAEAISILSRICISFISAVWTSPVSGPGWMTASSRPPDGPGICASVPVPSSLSATPEPSTGTRPWTGPGRYRIWCVRPMPGTSPRCSRPGLWCASRADSLKSSELNSV